ncbi:alpha/beta hydrolase [Luteolibacter yonseiensis]|uniref:Alpha/beta hydrolase n=1 Tax=Luteolibacter yonseiensis TaxID=1144680 RepID=A0A934R1Q5_9BACT|nr:alpha/beta hydrolase [Luteolibacter yonseiensis]MBK1814711.1 alpha/beta hydrolase [Luteolibacter yonseiensis]
MKTLLFLCLASLACAAPETILLWPDGAPGSEGKTTPEVVEVSKNGEETVTNIHKPSITVYLPQKGKANGAAVIVAPGGGHKLLCTTHEGGNVAEWLAAHGTAAFVLKYRLASEPGSTYTVDEHAVGDMHRAIRLVRSRATEWNINAAAVGVMGFSAGGEVCAISSMHFDAGKEDAADPLDHFSDKPDFQALIYPGRSFRIVPTKESPPAFLAASSNDRPDISEGLTKVYLDFKKAGVPVALHLYADGGHGFGYRAKNTGPVSHWIERFDEWLEDRKFTRN